MTVPKPSYRYRATLARIIDGDTVDLNVDLGFHASIILRLRLSGIDAPEHDTEAGLLAAVKLSDLIGGRDLIVESVKTEKFGRWLAAVWIDGDPVSVNEQLLRAGIVRPYDGGKRG